MTECPEPCQAALQQMAIEVPCALGFMVLPRTGLGLLVYDYVFR